VCIYSLRRCKITAFEINNFATKYVEKHVYGGVIQLTGFQYVNVEKLPYFAFRNVSKERKEKELLPYFENMS